MTNGLMLKEGQKARLVVLISGSGSNLQSLIDACDAGLLNAEIVAVISNKSGVHGLARATAANIPNIAIDHRAFDSREEFDESLAQIIESYQPDLVVLAGFMRILTSFFVNQFLGRLINIHPSLLPAYPGLNTHQRAIEAGDADAGATVHFVTAELDGGPPVLQARTQIETSDDSAALSARVLTLEHVIYPTAVQWFCIGRLQMTAGVAYLDGTALPEAGIFFSGATEL